MGEMVPHTPRPASISGWQRSPPRPATGAPRPVAPPAPNRSGAAPDTRYPRFFLDRRLDTAADPAETGRTHQTICFKGSGVKIPRGRATVSDIRAAPIGHWVTDPRITNLGRRHRVRRESGDFGRRIGIQASREELADTSTRPHGVVAPSYRQASAHGRFPWFPFLSFQGRTPGVPRCGFSQRSCWSPHRSGFWPGATTGRPLPWARCPSGRGRAASARSTP